MKLDLFKFDNTNNYYKYDKVSGIYALIYNDEVIYVGQSINIRKRLLGHHSYNAMIHRYENWIYESSKMKFEFYTFLKEKREDIYFLALPAEVENLNELEEHYINKYQPKYNWSGVKIKYTPMER